MQTFDPMRFVKLLRSINVLFISNARQEKPCNGIGSDA